jgi:transposase-like protein
MPNQIATRRPARKFSTEEKLKILREAQETSKYKVAKANEMQTSCLYKWLQQHGHLLASAESNESTALNL